MICNDERSQKLFKMCGAKAHPQAKLKEIDGRIVLWLPKGTGLETLPPGPSESEYTYQGKPPTG